MQTVTWSWIFNRVVELTVSNDRVWNINRAKARNVKMAASGILTEFLCLNTDQVWNINKFIALGM